MIMWTGVALSLVLGQANPDLPIVQLKELSEQRYRQVVKTPFGPQTSLLSFQGTVQGPQVKQAAGGYHLKLEQVTDDQQRDLIAPLAPDKPWDEERWVPEPESRECTPPQWAPHSLSQRRHGHRP